MSTDIVLRQRGSYLAGARAALPFTLATMALGVLSLGLSAGGLSLPLSSRSSRSRARPSSRLSRCLAPVEAQLQRSWALCC